MLKMPSFDMVETFVPLIHFIIDDILSKAMPDLRETMLQFINVVNVTSVVNVSVHPFMTKGDILPFNTTKEYRNNEVYLVNFVNNKAKW